MPLLDSDNFSLPLRVLYVIASPRDLQPLHESQLWGDISEALQPLISSGALVLELAAEATEKAIQHGLARMKPHVLHLVVHGREHASANYGTITLRSLDGYSRNLTASAAARLVTGSSFTRLVILQAADDASGDFAVVANAIAGKGAVVITAPRLNGHSAQLFFPKLYAGVLAQRRWDELLAEIRTAVEQKGVSCSTLRVIRPEGNEPPFATANTQMSTGEAQLLEGPAGAPAANVVAVRPPWDEALKQKRRSGLFDVFLCYHSVDAVAVKRVAEQLKAAAILPWLDADELPPGQPWQPLLEQQISKTRAAAVFVGSAGVGPWQQQELYCFLREFVDRKAPVIPVLLADAPAKPELPIFLRSMTWVDFRSANPDPMRMLIWGITGKKPEE